MVIERKDEEPDYCYHTCQYCGTKHALELDWEVCERECREEQGDETTRAFGSEAGYWRWKQG